MDEGQARRGVRGAGSHSLRETSEMQKGGPAVGSARPSPPLFDARAAPSRSPRPIWWVRAHRTGGAGGAATAATAAVRRRRVLSNPPLSTSFRPAFPRPRTAKICELYPNLEESAAIDAIIPKKAMGALAKWYGTASFCFRGSA